MKKTIVMPTLKPDMKEGVLCRWNAEEGDSVKKGDVLFEVETDKVVSEVEATEDMKLCRIIAEEGDTVAPGGALCEVIEG